MKRITFALLAAVAACTPGRPTEAPKSTGTNAPACDAFIDVMAQYDHDAHAPKKYASMHEAMTDGKKICTKVDADLGAIEAADAPTRALLADYRAYVADSKKLFSSMDDRFAELDTAMKPALALHGSYQDGKEKVVQACTQERCPSVFHAIDALPEIDDAQYAKKVHELAASARKAKPKDAAGKKSLSEGAAAIEAYASKMDAASRLIPPLKALGADFDKLEARDKALHARTRDVCGSAPAAPKWR